MNSSHAAFVQAFNQFIEGRTDEVRHVGEDYLTNLCKTLDSVPTMLFIIESSNQNNHLIIACSIIMGILKNFYDSIDQPTVEILYRALTKRLRPTTPVNPEDYGGCFNKLLQCIACIMSYFVDYLDFWPEFNPNELIQLFYELFCIKSEHNTDVNPLFVDKLINCADSISNVFRNADLTTNYLYLLAYLVEVYGNNSGPIFGAFYELLPLLQTIPNNQQLYPGFFKFYEEIAKNEYSNLEENTDKDFVEQLMIIFLQIIDTILQPEVDVDDISRAVYIWDAILDYDDDFKSESGNYEFVKEIFKKCNASLPIIANELSEFFFLISRLTDFYSMSIQLLTVQNGNDFWEEICEFMSYLIEVLDTEDENAYQGEIIAGCFNRISESHIALSSDRRYYFRYCQFFKDRLIQEGPISPGIIYAIASSVEIVHMSFSSLVSSKILQAAEQNALPSTSLYFYQNTAATLEKHFGPIITLLYNIFSENPSVECAKAIRSFTLNFPQQFTSRVNELVIPLLNTIRMVQPDVFIQLFATFTDIAPLLNEPERNELLLMIQIVTAEIIGQLIQVEEILEVFDFICSIVEETKVNQPQQFTEIYTEFYYAMFDKISEATINLWEVQSDVIMEKLCNFLRICIEKKWVRDLYQVFNWIERSIYICPCADHVRLLIKLICPKNNKSIDLNFLPTEGIINFLHNFSSCGDQALMEEILNYIRILYNWDQFFTQFSYEFLLAPLQIHNSIIISKTLSFLEDILKRTNPAIDARYAEQTANIIIEGVFTNFDFDVFTSVIPVLNIIGKQYSTEGILNIVFSNLKFMCPEADEFRDAFICLVQEPDLRADITPSVNSLKRMARLYRKPLSETAPELV